VTYLSRVTVVAVVVLLACGPARAEFIPLGDLPGDAFFSVASGVSADGAVVVGNSSSASGTQAFRWTAPTGLVGLGDLPGGAFASGATSVSADGAVVVGGSNSAAGYEAFVWDAANGMQSLRDVLITQGDDLAGWTLTEATAISADGTTVVGYGRNPSQQQEAWVARLHPVPEPSALALVGLGAAGLLAARAAGVRARSCSPDDRPADL
jgi:probable HAF family extracellular repeat protein